MNAQHAFVVPAYKESPYLHDCLASLVEQEVSSQVLMTTSTPNEATRSAAHAFGIELRINHGEGGIANDWNFALSQADARYVTIAHQDDIYLPSYSRIAIEALQKAAHPLIFFSDYGEIHNGEAVDTNLNLSIKRMLLARLSTGAKASQQRNKRKVLSLGCAISCPTVTYVMERMPRPLFRTGFRSNLDWDAWERLSKLDGAFVYAPQLLMRHRVHAGSETSAVIADNARTTEDLEILKRFWPDPVAKLIARAYRLSERSNKV